jgi:subtilisin family serine protease
VGPNGLPGGFSTHNEFVSLAGPGDFADGDCTTGIFSTWPTHLTEREQAGQACNRIFGPPGAGIARWAYDEGTSFASPIVAGLAALVWQANPRLRARQVGLVLQRSAQQLVSGPRWNEFTGTGAVDGATAVRSAPGFDTAAPSFSFGARRSGSRRLKVSISKVKERVLAGTRRPPGGLRVTLATARDKKGKGSKQIAAGGGSLSRTVSLSSKKLYLIALVCDGNENCTSKSLGPFKAS